MCMDLPGVFTPGFHKAVDWETLGLLAQQEGGLVQQCCQDGTQQKTGEQENAARRGVFCLRMG